MAKGKQIQSTSDTSSDSEIKIFYSIPGLKIYDTAVSQKQTVSELLRTIVETLSLPLSAEQIEAFSVSAEEWESGTLAEPPFGSLTPSTLTLGPMLRYPRLVSSYFRTQGYIIIRMCMAVIDIRMITNCFTSSVPRRFLETRDLGHHLQPSFSVPLLG